MRGVLETDQGLWLVGSVPRNKNGLVFNTPITRSIESELGTAREAFWPRGAFPAIGSICFENLKRLVPDGEGSKVGLN